MMKTIVRKIGLVAHDAMKKDMIEWVLWNSERLIGHKFYCTGTTGTLIKKALEEKHPETEWDITILKSGPLGGDQQMGSRIVEGEIDYLFFFTDPMTLQPHDTDVILRLLYSLYSIHNRKSQIAAKMIFSGKARKETGKFPPDEEHCI